MGITTLRRETSSFLANVASLEKARDDRSDFLLIVWMSVLPRRARVLTPCDSG